jgi:lytic murein transglycosylase
MHGRKRVLLTVAALGWAVIAAGHAHAAQCNDPAGFDKWLGDIRREAAAQGISQGAISAGLTGLTPDPGVIRRDRGQRFFKQSFEQFSAKMVPPYRIQKGTALLRQHAGLLSRIEQQFGVPGPVLIAIWGLESDFGAARGNLPAIRSIATLAYDCRRTELFTDQLFSALRIVQRGDLSPSEMRGAWAGEMGQTQFMATNYLKFAVDFDGDGRRDLIRSTPDVLASTANYLKGYGWQRGGSWEPGSANFGVLRQWNKSEVYARTIAYFASRIAGGGSRAAADESAARGLR